MRVREGQQSVKGLGDLLLPIALVADGVELPAHVEDGHLDPVYAEGPAAAGGDLRSLRDPHELRHFIAP